MSVLLEQALKLPLPERKKLADDIYESIETSADAAALTPAQIAELERRMEDRRLHPDDFYTWEEVRDAALAPK